MCVTVKRIAIMALFLVTLSFFYTTLPVGAELVVDEPDSYDVEVTGKSSPGKDVLVHFDMKWYRTKADETGNFKQILPKKIGDKPVVIREVEDDGFDSREVRISAPRNESFSVFYLGNFDGKRRFFNPEGYQIVALLNGKVYTGWEMLEVDATLGDEAKVYVSNGNERGETVTFDFNHPPKIPFSMKQLIKGESFEVLGHTLPRLAMEIQVKDGTGTWQSRGYFTSDSDGDFDYQLSQDLYRDGDKIDFRVHIRNLGEDVPVSDDLTKQYTMEAPQLTSENPIILFNEDRIRAGNTVEGRTNPGMRVHAKFDRTTSISSAAGPDGRFSFSIPSNFSGYPFIVLDVIDSKGNKFGEERHELGQANAYGWQVKMDKVTSDSKELTGLSRRYSEVNATYSNEKKQEYYTVSTYADSEGKFSIPIPRHTEGYFMIEGEDGNYSSLRQKINVIDVRTLNIPNYIFQNGEMIVNVRFPKNVGLSVEISKIKEDGTFTSSRHEMIKKNKNDDMYEAKISEWNDGDEFSSKLIDGNSIESSEVVGKYADIPLPEIDELTDDSPKITGRTTPGMTVSLSLWTTEILSVKSDSLGRFEFDISRLNVWERPSHLSVENSTLRTKRTIKLEYRDTTPPTLSMDSIRDDDSMVRGTMSGGERLELTIYYWNGKKVEGVATKSSTTRFFYDSGTSFRDVEKIEFRAIDSLGNTRKEMIIPSDTHYPRIDALDVPVQGDDTFMGWTDPQATVTVSINSKEYVSASDRTGFFLVKTDKLSLHDRVLIKIEDRGKNVNSQIVSEDVVGVTDIRLSADRTTITVMTNLKQRLQNVKVILEAGGQSLEKEISKPTDFRLSQKLKNHATVKVFLIGTSGDKTMVSSKKFSDTIPPVIDNGVVLRDDLTKEDHLYGKAENGSLVELLYKGKVVSSYKVIQYGVFDIPNKSTLKPGEKFVLRITDAAGNKSEKVLTVKHVPEKPQIDAVYDTSKAITGKTEPGLTVEIKVNKKKYLVKADGKGFYRLNGKGWLPGYSVVVKAKGKDGFDSPYERRTVKGIIRLTEVKNVTPTSRFLEGKTEPDSYVQVFKNGKSISKKQLISKDGRFKLSIPRQVVKTKLVVKVEKYNFKTLEKTLIVAK